MYVCLTPRVRASSEAVVVAAAVTFVDLPHPLGYYVRAFVYVRTDVRLHVSEQHDGLSQSVSQSLLMFARDFFLARATPTNSFRSTLMTPGSLALRPFVCSSVRSSQAAYLLSRVEGNGQRNLEEEKDARGKKKVRSE